MDFLELPITLVLSLLAAYVLAILLRVSCHFCGTEIPALGRAFGTALLTFFLSGLGAVVIQSLVVGGSGRPDLLLQFAALLLALAAHMLITVGLYIPLLGVRADRAFSIWLVQASIFAGLALLMGCCIAALARI